MTAPITTPVQRTVAGSGTDAHAIKAGSIMNVIAPAHTARPASAETDQHRHAFLRTIELSPVYWDL